MHKFPYKKFLLFDTMGVTLWSFIGVSLGLLLGTGVEKFFAKIEKIWHFLLMIGIGGGNCSFNSQKNSF